MNFDIVGYIGGILTTGAAVPQIIKTVKTKSLTDFSWLYLITLIIVSISAFGHSHRLHKR